MLGVSSAATIGLHFQVNYCASTPYSGFPVTMTAFGVASNGWENLTPMPSGYGCGGSVTWIYTLSETIDTTTATNGLNPLPNGSLSLTWTAATANYSGFFGYGDLGFAGPPDYSNPGNHPPIPVPSGESQVYLSFLRDGINFGPSPSNPGGANPDNDLPPYVVDITGLKSLFTNTPFVIELMASSDSLYGLTNAFVIDVTNNLTNSVSYPNFPPVNIQNGFGAPWLRGVSGGLSTASAVVNGDHVRITPAQPQHIVGPPAINNAATISGFIITDKPVVTMSPQPVLAGPWDTVQLSAYAIGVPPLACQWRLGGHSIPGATNLSYTFTNSTLAAGGDYDVVVTNLYGATTSQVATVTADLLALTPTNGIVLDSNPANPQRNGFNMGAAWEASSSDGTVTRTGVMSLVGTNTNGITVLDSANFNAATGTITFWMRSPGVDLNAQGFLSDAAALFCQPTGSAGKDFLIGQEVPDSGGNLLFDAPQVGINAFSSVASVSDNRWHFVALTFDQSASGGAAFFIDGALDSTNGNAGSWSWTAGQPLEIGYSSDADWGDYTGLLDDVRFYSRELSSAEISSIYHSGALVDTNALQMELNFTAAPDGGYSLMWQESSAVLQSSPNVNGPFEDVPGAISPYVIVPTAAHQFFRYRYAPQSVISNPYLM
jgi:hypothetical protein